MAKNIPGTNTGHGHVWERPDGIKARCGGLAFCQECQRDNKELHDAAESPQTEQDSQTEAEWWQEDAARYNAIGEHFQAAGELVGTAVKPPKLNPDGSLASK